MSEQHESLEGPDSRLPHEIAGIVDEPLEREDAVEAAAVPGDSAPEEAGTTPGPDLTFLDKENLRDTLGQILAEREDAQDIIDGLKDGYERKAAFTRKTQALARERKELEGLAEAGKHWKALEADPGLMDHILAYRKGGGPTQPEPELPQDIFEMNPQQIVDAVSARLEKKYAPVERELEQLKAQIAETAAPTKHINALEQTLVAWQDENRVTDDVMTEVGRTLQAEYDLRKISPEALEVFLPRLVHSVQAEKRLAAAQEKDQHESRRLSKARAASPVGNAGVSGTVEMTFDQRVAAAQKKLGRPLRADEVSSLAFEDFTADIHKATGITKDDLDRELKTKGYL